MRPMDRCKQDFQRLRRLESADRWGMVVCVSCGKRAHYKDGMHGGHFVKAQHSATRFLAENVNPQCNACNLYRNGMADKYRAWMVERFGKQRVEEIERMQFQSRKYTAEEIKEMRADYRQRIKLQELRLSLEMDETEFALYLKHTKREVV